MNQIIPDRHAATQGTVKRIRVSKVNGIGKEIHCCITIVKPSNRRLNRSKCRPTPSRFLRPLKCDSLSSSNTRRVTIHTVSPARIFCSFSAVSRSPSLPHIGPRRFPSRWRHPRSTIRAGRSVYITHANPSLITKNICCMALIFSVATFAWIQLARGSS